MLTDAHADHIPTTVIWHRSDMLSPHTIRVVSRNRPDSGRLSVTDQRTGLCIWNVQVGVNRDANGAVTDQDIDSWERWARVVIKGLLYDDEIYAPKHKRARA